MLMGNSLWQLITQSDVISWLVLLTLLSMSITCWAVFLCKVVVARLKNRHLIRAIMQLKQAKNIDDMLRIASAMQGTVPGYLLSKNLLYLKSVLENSRTRGGTLTTHEWELIQTHLDQTVDTLMNHEEAYLPILSTSAAVAPLLGLFGTVWGLVHAFVRISERQAADIVTVAPGIAQALMTTLAGLIVAIPALIMFNYLHVQARAIEQKLITLSDSMNMIVQKLLIITDTEVEVPCEDTIKEDGAKELQ